MIRRPTTRPRRLIRRPSNNHRPFEDQLERFLVLLFLRRYVTWCARSRRFASMDRAINLYDVVSLAP